MAKASIQMPWFKMSIMYQWSRSMPSYEFHFEGLSNFSTSVECLVQIQEYENEIQN